MKKVKWQKILSLLGILVLVLVHSYWIAPVKAEDTSPLISKVSSSLSLRIKTKTGLIAQSIKPAQSDSPGTTDSPAMGRKRKEFCRFFLPVGNPVPRRPIPPLAARAKPATRRPALGQNGNAPSAARPGEARFPSPGSSSARDHRSVS